MTTNNETKLWNVNTAVMGRDGMYGGRSFIIMADSVTLSSDLVYEFYDEQDKLVASVPGSNVLSVCQKGALANE